MSGKLMSVLVALGILSSAAFALTVMKSDFGGSVDDRTYPAKADFDRTFAAIMTASTSNREVTTADRENLRAAGLRRMNLARFGEQ